MSLPFRLASLCLSLLLFSTSAVGKYFIVNSTNFSLLSHTPANGWLPLKNTPLSGFPSLQGTTPYISVYDPTNLASHYNWSAPTGVPENITLEFTGSSIAVYGYLLSGIKNIGSLNADYWFSLDGEPAGSYSGPPSHPVITSSDGQAEATPLYSNSSLNYAQHTFTLQNGRSGGSWSVIVFDRFVYTAPDNPSSQNSPGTPAAPPPAAPPPPHAPPHPSISSVFSVSPTAPDVTKASDSHVPSTDTLLQASTPTAFPFQLSTSSNSSVQSVSLKSTPDRSHNSSKALIACLAVFLPAILILGLAWLYRRYKMTQRTPASQHHGIAPGWDRRVQTAEGAGNRWLQRGEEFEAAHGEISVTPAPPALPYGDVKGVGYLTFDFPTAEQTEAAPSNKKAMLDALSPADSRSSLSFLEGRSGEGSILPPYEAAAGMPRLQEPT